MSVGNGKLAKPDWDTVSSTATHTNQLAHIGSPGKYITSALCQREDMSSIHATTLDVSTPIISGSEHSQTTCMTKLPKDGTQGIQRPIVSTVAKSTTRKWLAYGQGASVIVSLVNNSELVRPRFIGVLTADERSAQLARDRVGPLFLEVS